MREIPRIALVLYDFATLADVQRWAELADALSFPPSSAVEVGIGTTLTVRATLPQVRTPEEWEPETCHDAACMNGPHDDAVRHFDGQEVWG